MRTGLEEGARLVRGGERVKREHDGFYLEPALFVEPREQGRYAAKFFTAIKTSYTAA